MKLISRSTSSASALVLLLGAAHAQSTGPLTITQNAVFALGNQAPNLSLDGNQLAARETANFGNPSSTGVHVLQRSAGAWSQQMQVSVPYGSAFGTLNGNNVALRGTRLVAGVCGAADATGDVRISEFSAGSWGPFAVVPNPTDLNNFADSVLARENLVFVGMPSTSIALGEVHIFRFSASHWIREAGFSEPSASGVYGTLLADSGDTMLIATDREVDVRVRGATALVWGHQALLNPPASGIPLAIAIDGDVAVVASQTNPSIHHVQVFERTGTSWAETATLSGSDTLSTDWFGSSVGVHGDTIYVGAALASSHQGALYVFQRQGAAWMQTARLTPSVPVANGEFGRSLVVDGTTLAVGATTSSATPTAGAVYLFDIVPLAPPQTYCTAKVNSQGCLPQIGDNGIPGATNPNAFAITATNELNQKTGMLLYSIAGSATTPFQGGTLCIAAPLHRTPAQNSGGNVGPSDCSGSYSFDFNARVQSGIDPGLTPGVQVWAQFYSRDPADPFGVGLSDAVTFTIGS